MALDLLYGSFETSPARTVDGSRAVATPASVRSQSFNRSSLPVCPLEVCTYASREQLVEEV